MRYCSLKNNTWIRAYRRYNVKGYAKIKKNKRNDELIKTHNIGEKQ